MHIARVNFGNVTRKRNLKTEAKRIKAPINNHWTVGELWNYPNFPYFVIIELRMYASCMILRPFPWRVCCANAFRIPKASAMLVTPALESHLPVTDANDEDDDCCARCHHEVHSPADPDQNFHYLSLASWHNIDYQTLHYQMAVNLPIHNVPFPSQDTANVAGNRGQFHEKNWSIKGKQISKTCSRKW